MRYTELMEANSKYYFVGTCVNSFDEDDGTCVFDNYQDVSDFAQSEEEAERIDAHAFYDAVAVPDQIARSLTNHELQYLRDIHRDVYMIYDVDSDIHYFFVS